MRVRGNRDGARCGVDVEGLSELPLRVRAEDLGPELAGVQVVEVHRPAALDVFVPSAGLADDQVVVEVVDGASEHAVGVAGLDSDRGLGVVERLPLEPNICKQLRKVAEEEHGALPVGVVGGAHSQHFLAAVLEEPQDLAEVVVPAVVGAADDDVRLLV